MKDYRLSEIKNHDWRENWDVSDDISKGHREYEILRELQHDLGIYDIEPRDMIELPCKLPAVSGKQLQVVYRDKYGYVRSKPYDLDEEAEADEFLAMLKGDKQ